MIWWPQLDKSVMKVVLWGHLDLAFACDMEGGRKKEQLATRICKCELKVGGEEKTSEERKNNWWNVIQSLVKVQEREGERMKMRVDKKYSMERENFRLYFHASLY